MFCKFCTHTDLLNTPHKAEWDSRWKQVILVDYEPRRTGLPTGTTGFKRKISTHFLWLSATTYFVQKTKIVLTKLAFNLFINATTATDQPVPPPPPPFMVQGPSNQINTCWWCIHWLRMKDSGEPRWLLLQEFPQSLCASLFLASWLHICAKWLEIKLFLGT